MPDPCPHVTRIDLITAKLENNNEIINHVLFCEAEPMPDAGKDSDKRVDKVSDP